MTPINSNKDFRKHARLLASINDYWFRNQLFCAWHVIFKTTGVAKQASTCFLDAAAASTEEISIYYISATDWTPPALSNAESHFVLLGNITVTPGSKVLPQSSVERAEPEWLRCSGKNNHQQGEERIRLLERQVAVSWKSVSRAASQWTQMHMFCHAWVDVAARCMLVTPHVGKEKVSRHNKSDAHLFSLACWEEPMRGSRFSDITSRQAVLSSG